MLCVSTLYSSCWNWGVLSRLLHPNSIAHDTLWNEDTSLIGTHLWGPTPLKPVHTTLWNKDTSLIGTHLLVPNPLKPVQNTLWNENTSLIGTHLYKWTMLIPDCAYPPNTAHVLPSSLLLGWRPNSIGKWWFNWKSRLHWIWHTDWVTGCSPASVRRLRLNQQALQGLIHVHVHVEAA